VEHYLLSCEEVLIILEKQVLILFSGWIIPGSETHYTASLGGKPHPKPVSPLIYSPPSNKIPENRDDAKKVRPDGYK